MEAQMMLYSPILAANEEQRSCCRCPLRAFLPLRSSRARILPQPRAAFPAEQPGDASRMPVAASEPETFAGSFANLKVNEGAVVSTCSRLGLTSLPAGSWASAASSDQSLSPAAGRGQVRRGALSPGSLLLQSQQVLGFSRSTR